MALAKKISADVWGVAIWQKIIYSIVKGSIGGKG